MSLRGLSAVRPVLISIRLTWATTSYNYVSSLPSVSAVPFPSAGGFIKHPSQFAIIFILLGRVYNINKAYCC